MAELHIDEVYGDKSKNRPEDQQMPVHKPDQPSMHDLLIEEVNKRKQLGLSRYGTILQANNGRDALQDAIEEAIDLCVYLMQLKEERKQSE